MIYIQADARDGFIDPCKPCCCDIIPAIKGETTLISIDYSAWAIPAGYMFLCETVLAQEACNVPGDPPTPVNLGIETETKNLNLILKVSIPDEVPIDSIYRITITQEAMNCSCEKVLHKSCLLVKILKC